MAWLQEHFQDLLTTYADRWVAFMKGELWPAIQTMSDC